VPIRVTGETRQITEAINGFPANYQTDFSEVRAIARQYLAGAQPTDNVVSDLAMALRCVLRCWGAGNRGAPNVQNVQEFKDLLGRPEIHASLAVLARTPLSALNVVQQHRYLHGKPATLEELVTFDLNFFYALRAAGERLFIGNTNAAYPMKAVLLVTGFMPAFDGHVRTGLQRGGFRGMNKTQFFLPKDTNCTDGKKVARLPFLLGECWASCAPQLRQGIENSRFSTLFEEPGRVFDVLLFMQAGKEKPVLVTWDPPDDTNWYELP